MPWSNHGAAGRAAAARDRGAAARRRAAAAQSRGDAAARAGPVQAPVPGGGGGGFGGNRGRSSLIPLIVRRVWLASGFYRVQPDEQGMVLRFGAYKTAQPGLNYHLPTPIESCSTPNVTRINRIEIGYRSTATAAAAAGRRATCRRKPDADRRREHRRHQLRRPLADQGRAAIPVQHPRPRGDRQVGGRERDARDRRPDADRPGADRRPRRDRVQRAS